MTNSAKIKSSDFEDLVLGDKNIYAEELHPLEKAIKAIQDTVAESPGLQGIIEELAEYTTNRPDREIVGVEAKLVAGGREDALENAVYYKNAFERRIAKKQLSRVEQHIYAHVLAMIETTFNQYVRPLILAGESKAIVDAAVHEKIFVPVYKAIVGFDATITTQHVAGMLYFLTGKCHLMWSE
ncbi:MAG: ABC-three component system protein [Congregibacter sp.]